MPTRGFLIILICTACGVVLGSLVGLLLGSVAPDFCLAVFGGASARIDASEGLMNLGLKPINRQQLGIGLGIANGVWVGLIAGIAIVIGEAIKSLKRD